MAKGKIPAGLAKYQFKKKGGAKKSVDKKAKPAFLFKKK